MPIDINAVRTDIESLIVFLLENNLALATNPPIIRTDGDFQYLTWSGAPQRISVTFSQTLSAIPEYYSCLDGDYFHALLFDGSILQFGYVFENGELTRHRLLYYPCPVSIPSDFLGIVGPGDDFRYLFDDQLAEELNLLQRSLNTGNLANLNSKIHTKTPIRFDYSNVNAKRETGHSLSHMHFNDRSCRWSVYGPVSIGHFVRIIFKSFYKDIWGKYEILRTWPVIHHARTISIEETKDLFIECNPSSKFSKEQIKSLFFGLNTKRGNQQNGNLQQHN